MKHYYPKLVYIYNYPEANSIQLKLVNWNTLCLKVFRKIGFSISKIELENVVNRKPKAIENVLRRLFNKLLANGKIHKKAETKNEFQTSIFFDLYLNSMVKKNLIKTDCIKI